MREIFIHNQDGGIRIGDLSIPADLFYRIEPTYRLPPGYVGRHYEGSRISALVLVDGTYQDDPEFIPLAMLYLGRVDLYAGMVRRSQSPDKSKVSDRRVKPLGRVKEIDNN